MALTASANPDHLDDLLMLLREDSRGDTRIHFLGKIKELGGQTGRDILTSLKADPMLGREARALLQD